MGEGQKTQTKSWAVMHTIQECINQSVCHYHVTRDVLLQLDPSETWQELYPPLNNHDNCGPGKELEEVSTSDGQYTPSWIWLSNPNVTTGDPTQSTVSPDEVNEDMWVEWAQSIARANCWEEEVILLQEEMQQVIHFLDWKSKDWASKADVRAGVVTPEVSLGLAAYAHKQASIFRNLAVQFCWHWQWKLIALSLSHDWATKFLKAQATLLINPGAKKNKPEDKEHGPSGSSVSPPLTNSLATDTTAASPISTNPEIGDSDNGSSDDSDVDPEELDESEYKSWYE
jgi:hypothetical protein